MVTIKTKLLLLLIAFAITSCGFQLRGSYSIPYQAVYVQADVDSRVGRALKKKIDRKYKDMLVDAASAAEVVINIVTENSTRSISVLSNSGSVDEFELGYSVQYKFYSPQDESSALSNKIILSRKMTFSDQNIVSSSSEERSLITDMADEGATRILVRLSRGGI